MTEFRERRRALRIAVPGQPGGRVRATSDARLLDLSSMGARIEHYHLLRPGDTCTLELPPSVGALALSARVVRSTIVGMEKAPAGEKLLRYESGLAFVGLTPDQQATLDSILSRLASGGNVGDRRLVL